MPTLIAHKRWDLPVPDPQLQAQISSALHIHPILVQLLINRGIATILEAEAFLNISLDQMHCYVGNLLQLRGTPLAGGPERLFILLSETAFLALQRDLWSEP